MTTRSVPPEALDQQPPRRPDGPNRRLDRGRPPPRYPTHRLRRRGRGGGEIKWPGRLRFGGEAFAGFQVALQRVRQGVGRVHFYHVLLGELQDADASGLRPAGHPRCGSGPRKVSRMFPVQRVNDVPGPCHHSGRFPRIRYFNMRLKLAGQGVGASVKKRLCRYSERF